jgi:hypothetical protein
MGDQTLHWKEPSAGVSRSLIFSLIVAIAAICASPIINDIHRIHRQDTGDFVHFYYAADAVRHHADPYAAWTQGYIYPPLIAFLFQPLSFLGRDRAAGLMLGVNVAVTLIAIALASDEFLRRFGSSRSKLAVLTVMLLAILMNVDKIKGEWQMWQTDVFMLLLFVLALRWLDRRPVAAGLALGIAVNIKYLPLLLLPYLLIRRRWTTTASLVISTMVFATLPALSTGWDANLRNWHTATNGLVEMTGAASSTPEAAEIHGVTDSLSCSITSALARITRHPQLGFALAAAVALAAFALCWLIYRRRHVAMFRPVTDARQRDAVTGVEWVMLLSAILAFSPQTNTRHLFDALLLTTAASALIIFARPTVNRIPLLVGCTIMVLGFVLPPGHRTRIGEHNATIDWLRYGGPCWCLLIAAMTLLWTAFEGGVSAKR